MKRVLVLVQDYPNNVGGVTLMYVHTRNKFYIENNIKVDVLSFSAKSSYTYEGIRVFPENEFIKTLNKYDMLISHAPNIKNHKRFIKRNHHYFKRIIFFFHGHEILIKSKEYPNPYFYTKRNNFIYKAINNFYDKYKLNILRSLFKKMIYKTDFVFVSEWMYMKFKENIFSLEQEISKK